ncbi:MAG: hypothetical protein MI867_25770 [Pseudomonadales bacterium]|nr:hypothetical protein [Pseudomonadales bacterium]
MNIKIGAIVLLLFIPVFTYADTAECEIDIEDVNASVANKKVTKINKLETFVFEPGANALTATQRKYFKLPGSQYTCILAFVNLQTGMSLSCESTEDQGYTYFQSEQSGSVGDSNKIYLTFRHAISHFTIRATCKKA